MMFQLLTVLFALGAISFALLTSPVWGWIAFGAIDLFIIVMFWSVKRQYQFNHVKELSVEANAMLRRYGHYFAMPFASRDFSASAATSQFAGALLASVCVFKGSWWGIVLGLANWGLMGLVAVALSPAAVIAQDLNARLAHDEVVAYLELSHRRMSLKNKS
jgi:hypothetical protein